MPDDWRRLQISRSLAGQPGLGIDFEVFQDIGHLLLPTLSDRVAVEACCQEGEIVALEMSEEKLHE